MYTKTEYVIYSNIQFMKGVNRKNQPLNIHQNENTYQEEMRVTYIFTNENLFGEDEEEHVYIARTILNNFKRLTI